MADIHLSPPLSFRSADHDLLRMLGSQMNTADQVVVDSQDAAGGAVTAPIRTPSSSSNAPPKVAEERPALKTYLAYCSEFLDLGQYPKLAEQDRAVIADFISGELLQNLQWKYLFPHGAFECILNSTAGPETDDYACTEYTVFKINFETISCSKDTRRIWTSKTKPMVDEPTVSESINDAERNQSLGLHSPIKPSNKRRTPTRRRSFDDNEHRTSTSRTRSVSIEPPPPVKKMTKSTPKPRKKAEKATAPNAETEAVEETPQAETAAKKDVIKAETNVKKKTAATTLKKTTPRKTTPKKASVSKKKAAVPVMIPSEETYAVLTILDYKKVGVKILYLVRWAGLDTNGKPWEDTWEPASNITNDLIHDFWQRQNLKSKTADAPSEDKVDDKVSVELLLDSDPPAM